MLPPVPLMMLHAPVPAAGVFAARAVDVTTQPSSLHDALLILVAVAGISIATSSLEVHDPLVMVHLKVYVWPDVPVKFDVGELEVVMLPPVSLMMLHAPVPAAGVFAARAVDVTPQPRFWSVPAL